MGIFGKVPIEEDSKKALTGRLFTLGGSLHPASVARFSEDLLRIVSLNSATRLFEAGFDFSSMVGHTAPVLSRLLTHSFTDTLEPSSSVSCSKRPCLPDIGICGLSPSLPSPSP